VRQSDLYVSLVQVMLGAQPQATDVATTVEEIASAPQAGSRGKILLVEDNLVNQAVALGMLQKLQGFEVVVANNGNEALEAYQGGVFDAILMDCHMPELDGFEATVEIRKREKSANRKRTPIIALTANAMEQDKEDCLNAGMDDHLAKPLSRLQLKAKLDRWMPEALSAQPDKPAAAPITPVKEVDILDRQVLSQLRELESIEDPHLLSRVLMLYLEDAPKLVEKLKRAVDQKDAREIELNAHTLKSSSANIGATALASHCGELHSVARAMEIDGAARIFSVVEAAFSQVQSAVAAEVRQLAAVSETANASTAPGWKA
jgi:CheY-like chemotaxis protein